MRNFSQSLVTLLLPLCLVFPLVARASATYRENWIATGFIGVNFTANGTQSTPMCTGANEWYVEGTNPTGQEWYRELWQATNYVTTGNMLEETNPQLDYIDQVHQVPGMVKYPSLSTVNLDTLKQEVLQAQSSGELRALCQNASGYIHPNRTAVMRPAGEFGAWITNNNDQGTDVANRWWLSLGVVTFPTLWEVRGQVITP